jgi:hypothetical protein
VNRTSITIACAVMCVSLRGLAGPTAGQAVVDAEAKVEAGDYVGAAAKYLEAYAADSKPEYLCDVGVAYNKAKTELPRAHLFLGRCIERGTVLDPKFITAVHAALATVEAALHAGKYTPIDISVEPASTRVEVSAFTAAEGFVGSRAIWLPYGTHQLTFSADGFVSETREVQASTSRSVSIAVVLQRKPIETNVGSGTESGSGSDAGSASVGSAGEAGSGSAIVVPPPPIHTESSHASKVPAIVATAVSAALVVGAAYTFHSASKRADAAPFALDPETFQSDKDYVSKQNTYTIVLGSLGLVGAGVSGYLWYRALHETSTRVEVNATGNGATVSVGGRF